MHNKDSKLYIFIVYLEIIFWVIEFKYIKFNILCLGESGKISTTQNLEVSKSPWLHHWLPALL